MPIELQSEEKFTKRICDDIKAIKMNGKHADLKICRSFMSRHGYVKNSNSAKFKRKSKYNDVFSIAKKVISYEAKSSLHRKAA